MRNGSQSRRHLQNLKLTLMFVFPLAAHREPSQFDLPQMYVTVYDTNHEINKVSYFLWRSYWMWDFSGLINAHNPLKFSSFFLSKIHNTENKK